MDNIPSNNNIYSYKRHYYYDGRVSLLIWILLAGLKCIIDEYKININLKKSDLNI